MITPSLPRPLILAAAAMLAADAVAQTTPPPAFDPVIALEQAVQLADIQNDPAGAKAFLEKLTGPEIPAKIREQAKARLEKMNGSSKPLTEATSSPAGSDNKGAATRNAESSTPTMSAPERLEEAMNLLVSAGAKDRSALVDAAIDGMAKSMGRSGEFISAEEIRKSHVTLNENTGGIGAVMGGDQRGVFIWNALPGSSAAKAGIEDESIVLEVDGKTPFALGGDVPAVITAIRGLVGTRVKLKLKSPSGEVREVELERERRGSYPAKCEQLNSSLLPADVLGIAIGGFDEGARTKVSAILDQEAFRAKLPRGLIIDLRGNSGGSLTEAMAIADFFLTQGVVVTHREEDGRIVSPHAVEDEMFAGVPIAVLVDEGTASSAEVLAAALQDHHRAAIIGRRTAGAGSVSEPHSLKGGGSVKFPVAWFVRPSGADLERYPHMTESDPWGVVPDIVVAAAPRKPLKPGQITKPKDEDQNLMIQAALAHFESLNAKE